MISPLKKPGFHKPVYAIALLATLPLLAPPSTAAAQPYPNRTIKLVVPYSAGSGADITARQTMAKLATILNQSIVIENRPGASGMTGTDQVARAAPDGYTLLFGVTQHAINPSLQKKLPYDTLADFIPVARVTSQPLFLGVSTALPGNSVVELIRHVKEHPGKFNYASTGIGTSIHLAGAFFAYKADLQMSHVPYTNASQTITDLGRGEVQVLFYTYQPLMPQVLSGRVKILGTTGAARSSWAPDVPTMVEAQVPDFVMPAWHGVFAPANTPSEVVDVLEKALARVAADPDYKKTLEPTGTDIYYASSKEFDRFVRSEIERFRQIIEISGTKTE
jgi:tripartite-type tricarboxylate transporter receptor subunit TctC